MFYERLFCVHHPLDVHVIFVHSRFAFQQRCQTRRRPALAAVLRPSHRRSAFAPCGLRRQGFAQGLAPSGQQWRLTFHVWNICSRCARAIIRISNVACKVVFRIRGLKSEVVGGVGRATASATQHNAHLKISNPPICEFELRLKSTDMD